MSTRRILARPAVRLAAVSGAAALIGLSIAGPAGAHVTVTPSTSAAGAYTVLTFSNGHGCEGSPTTKVTIQIPDGINAATPTRNSFYDVTKQMEQLDPPVTDAHGNELTERVDTVTYTAKTALPDGYRDYFEVQVQIPEDVEGETLNFPTVQTCQQGETAWTEIPQEGQSADDLESPAPAFVVTAAEGDGHGGSDEAAEGEASDGAAPVAGDGESAEEAPAGEEQAAAASDDDGNGNGLAIAGLTAGVIGILVGAAALARGRKTA